MSDRSIPPVEQHHFFGPMSAHLKFNFRRNESQFVSVSDKLHYCTSDNLVLSYGANLIVIHVKYGIFRLRFVCVAKDLLQEEA